jgi:hypothetical protein
MSGTRESSSHSHGHSHHGTSQSPAVMAERLLELKNSDPELFSQAWRQIPQSTQDNILAYLKKHGGVGQTSSSSHENFEDKDIHLRKHKESTGHTSEPTRLERKEYESKHLISAASIAETPRSAPFSGRPLYEWTDGELLAHTLLDTEARDSVSSGHGKPDDDLASVLRIISKQNMVQIVQNELMRRLLQTIAGKA